MKRRILPALVVALLSALSAACIVEIRQVSDPRPVFDDARAEAARSAEHPGPARGVTVLAYSPSDGKLVKVSAPMWLVRKVAKHAHDDDQEDGGRVDGDEGDDLARRLHGRVPIEELLKQGRGAIFEVEEDDGEQVLVWLR